MVSKQLYHAYLIIMHSTVVIENDFSKNIFRAIAKGTLTKYEGNSSKNTEINHCAKEKVCIQKQWQISIKEPEVEGTDSAQLTSVIGLGLDIPSFDKHCTVGISMKTHQSKMRGSQGIILWKILNILRKKILNFG